MHRPDFAGVGAWDVFWVPRKLRNSHRGERLVSGCLYITLVAHPCGQNGQTGGKCWRPPFVPRRLHPSSPIVSSFSTGVERPPLLVWEHRCPACDRFAASGSGRSRPGHVGSQGAALERKHYGSPREPHPQADQPRPATARATYGSTSRVSHELIRKPTNRALGWSASIPVTTPHCGSHKRSPRRIDFIQPTDQLDNAHL